MTAVRRGQAFRTAALIMLGGTGALLAIALVDRWLGGGPRPLLAHGMADESAHLLTAVLLLMVAAPRFPPVAFVAGTLVGAVVIDLDHLPLILGSELLTRTTNRPLTHGLLTVACVLAVTLPIPRWRWTGLGLAFGLAAHFWRDMATSTAGVPLLWPLATDGFRLPYALYVGSLSACVIVAALRAIGDRPSADRAENTKS